MTNDTTPPIRWEPDPEVTLVSTGETPQRYRRFAGRRYPVRPGQFLPAPGTRGTLFGIPGIMGPGLEWEMTESLTVPSGSIKSVDADTGRFESDWEWAGLVLKASNGVTYVVQIDDSHGSLLLDRPPREVPSTTNYREFVAGPDEFATVRIHGRATKADRFTNHEDVRRAIEEWRL
jgi:hypothetical protein